jgi:hypothetical protein
MKSKRIAFLFGCAGTFGAFGIQPAISAPIWNVSQNNWAYGAYSDDQTGIFSHCAATAPYKSGISLMFSVNRYYRWTMGFTNPAWNLKRDINIPISFWVDNLLPQQATATTFLENAVKVDMVDSVGLFNAFRRGQMLHISVSGKEVGFRLTRTSEVLTNLLNCVKGGGAKPMPPNAAPTLFQTNGERRIAPNTSTPSIAVDYRSEAMLVGANLVSEMGLSGFKFLSTEEAREFNSDAAWIVNKSVGTVKIIPGNSTPAKISAKLIGDAAAGCQSAFASGTLPAGEDHLTRLFTRCGTGDGALVGYLFILPRKSGGNYLIGTYSKAGEEESVKMADTGVRNAVFKAIPK